MKLPSIDYLISNAISSFKRFPLVIVSAFFAVVLSIIQYENEIEFNDENFILTINLILTFVLGIILFFTTKIFIERQNYTKNKAFLVHSLSILFLFLLYLSLPSDDITITKTVPYIRFFIFSIILHLIVSFIPYLKKGDINGFWNFNKTLFLRFLTSILFTGAFYIGVTIAISSSDFLFDLDLGPKSYLYLFYISMGLFNTWFFIFGIPQDFEELSANTNYPRGLKIFTQYILLPLLILYILILYLYIGKVLLIAEWPKGIIPYMVFGVSVLGIFLNLLMYPYRNSTENSWINKFSRIYYIILIPLISLMFYAIIVRIGEYGITINRYVILALAFWLSFISLYFTVNGKNIKIIPISLSLMLFVISFGPWSIFNVSESSQISRLEKILTDAEILKDGKIQNEVIWQLDSIEHYRSYEDSLQLEDNEKTTISKIDTSYKYIYQSDSLLYNDNILSDSLHNEVYSIMKYLDEFHGYNDIKNWYSQNIDSLIVYRFENKADWDSYLSNFNLLINTMGLSEEKKYKGTNGTYFRYQIENQMYNKLPQNYSFLIHGLNWRDFNNRENVISTDELNIKLSFSNEDIPELTIQKDSINYDLEFKKFLLEKINRYDHKDKLDLQNEDMRLYSDNEKIDIIIDISKVEIKYTDDVYTLDGFNINLYLKIK